MARDRVQGHCPSCGGDSLFVGAGGYITCSRSDCERPDAASDVLERRVRAMHDLPPAEQAAAEALLALTADSDGYTEYTITDYAADAEAAVAAARPIIEADALSAAARVLADCAARHRARQALSDPSAMSPGEIGGMETAASAVAQLAEDATIRGMAARGGDGRG